MQRFLFFNDALTVPLVMRVIIMREDDNEWGAHNNLHGDNRGLYQGTEENSEQPVASFRFQAR
jgi:hypothetical protein